MGIHEPHDQALKRENEDLRRQLAEAQGTLDAIRAGEVDAIVVNQGEGSQVFTLEGAERPYRIFVEEMQQGAVTLDPDGRILFSNRRFREMVQVGHEKVIGRSFVDFIQPGSREVWRSLVDRARSTRVTGEILLGREDGGPMPASIGITTMDSASGVIHCLVMADLTEQKHYHRLIETERALRLSEERFRLTLVSIGKGVITTDNQGSVNFINPVAEALTGWTRAEALGSPVRAVFNLISEETHEPLSAPLTKGFQEGRTGKPGLGCALLNHAGKEIPIEYNTAPIYDRDGSLTGAVVVFQDLSAQRLAERSLRLSEERRRLAARAAMVGTYTFDFATREAHLSEEFRTLWGLKPLDPVILDESWILGLDAENRDIFKTAITAALDPEWDGQVDFEYKVTRPNGSIRWLNIKGHTEFLGTGAARRPLRAFGAAVDITERKNREQEVLGLNRTLRAISNSSQALMRSQTAPEGDYLAEICRIITEDCGYARVWIGFAEADEAKSIRPVASAGFEAGHLGTLDLTWSDTERGRGPCGNAIRTGMPCMCRDMLTDPAFEPWRAEALERGYRSSLVLPLKEGEWTFGTLTIHAREADAFPEAEVALLHQLASDLAHGITLNRLRAEHAKAEEAIRESSRRKDEFLAILAHELRNPLAPIRNAAHILKLRGSEDPVLKSVYDLIGRQAGQLARLVDDLLDVSRLERGKIELRRERVDFCSLVGHAVEVCRNLIEEYGHRVGWDLPEQALEVDGDPVRVEQMMCNLITNACKHTPPGGAIRIAVGRDGSEAVFRVRDNGIGMAPEQMEHIFDMFYQAGQAIDHREGGLGLGLTLVRSLAELHGGSIAAASEGLGKGSEFTLRLPALEPADSLYQALAPDQTSVLAAGVKPKHILVIDDNPSVVMTLKMLLSDSGYQVSVAATGAAGIKQALNLRPDLALVDLGLPDLNGLEVAARIRTELGSDIRLIALTGFSRESDISAALAAGFDQHLVKSADPKELVAVVNAQLA